MKNNTEYKVVNNFKNKDENIKSTVITSKYEKIINKDMKNT